MEDEHVVLKLESYDDLQKKADDYWSLKQSITEKPVFAYMDNRYDREWIKILSKDEVIEEMKVNLDLAREELLEWESRYRDQHKRAEKAVNEVIELDEKLLKRDTMLLYTTIFSVALVAFSLFKIFTS